LRLKDLCPPPRRFRAAGLVEKSALTTQPSFILTEPRGASPNRQKGINYEKKVQVYLARTFPGVVVHSPWVRFVSTGSPKFRFCQPDAILFDLRRGIICVVEVKLSHTSNAWWQVRRLYAPVLAHLFRGPRWRFVSLEIVKWYDPATKFPEKVTILHDLSKVFETEKGFHVHIWNGKQ
jgi:hypothetical protein